MDHHSFRGLLTKYESGSATTEEKELIEHWYGLLGNNNNHTGSSDEELKLIKSQIWQGIHRAVPLQATGTGKQTKIFTLFNYKWVSAAAVIAGISFLFYFSQNIAEKSSTSHTARQKGLLQKTNETNLPQLIALEDGSEVTLQPGASLQYPGKFSADKREVYLKGEAFFKVSKNPRKQFLVYTGSVTTQVLGTSFTIKPDEKTGKMVVSVKTGKVVVYEERQKPIKEKLNVNNGVIITPNQKATYSTATKSFTTGIVDNPLPVLTDEVIDAAANLSMVFEDVPVNEVINKFIEVYGIEIIPESENLYYCHFTGSLEGLSLFQSLNILCTTLGHNYEIKGTKILITGKGCN